MKQYRKKNSYPYISEELNQRSVGNKDVTYQIKTKLKTFVAFINSLTILKNTLPYLPHIIIPFGGRLDIVLHHFSFLC